MILNSRYLPLILSITVAFSAWASTTSNAPAKNGGAKPVAAVPTSDALLALEKQANEAYIKGDGKFFDTFLSDKLVVQKGGSRLSKADVVKMISGVRCEVKKGWALTGPRMLQIDDDAYVLSYVSDMQGSCTADGKTEKLPSPVRAATVWVRNGQKWQVAFHGENLIIDPKAPPATDKAEGPRKDDKAAANVNTTAAQAPAKLIADPITNAVMKVENAVWEAWMTKDAPKLEGLTARDIAFVDVFGTYTATKTAVVKVWTSSLCDVSSLSLTNGVGTIVSPKVAILTLTGTVNGTCGGKDISGLKIHGNTVYVKDGNAWKWVFGFNSPT